MFSTFRRRFGGLALLVASALMAKEAFTLRHNNNALDLYGKTAIVDPITHYTTITHKRWGLFTSSIDYRANISFTTDAGKVVEISADIPDTVLFRFQSHEDVSIQYLPDTPTIIRWPGHKHGWIGLLVISLLASTFAIALLRSTDE